MAEKLSFIWDITPETKNWTVKVQVVEKNSPRTSSVSTRFQRLILKDSEDTRIQAMIYGSDIELFQITLAVNKKYNITNAAVKQIPPAIRRIVANEYQWNINGGTLVEESTIITDIPPTRTYEFTPFSDLSEYANTDTTVDIVAVALRISPEKQISTKNGPAIIRELLLITEEFKTMKLTLWDQFVSNEGDVISKFIDSWPIILATRLKVVPYKSTALSTRSTSFLMVNPDIPEAKSLRSWSIENKDELIIILSGLPSETESSRSASKGTVIDIASVHRGKPLDTFWVNASASISNPNQKFWYVGCSNCYKTIYAEPGRIYDCRHCNQHSVKAQARYRIDVSLQDATGTIKATCLGKNAEELFDITTEGLEDITNKDSVTCTKFLVNVAPSPTRLMLLKKSKYQAPGTGEPKLTIIAIKDDNDESSQGTPL